MAWVVGLREFDSQIRWVHFDQKWSDEPPEHSLNQNPSSVVRLALGSGTVDTADIKWLNTAETARRLGVTPRTLYRFIDDGQLPAYRFGRVIRLKETEVEQFIERCRIRPGTLDITTPTVNATDAPSAPADTIA